MGFLVIDFFLHPFINLIVGQKLAYGEFLLKIFLTYFNYYFNISETGQFFFLLCLVCLLISTSLLLVLTESPVHSLIYLMLLLLYLSQLSIYFQMHFLGLIFIIIYVGCVSVLLLLHINMIVSFISRYTIVKKKNYFFPLIFVCIIIPLIQIITLFFSDVYFFKPMYNDIFHFLDFNKIDFNLDYYKISLEWLYIHQALRDNNIYKIDIDLTKWLYLHQALKDNNFYNIDIINVFKMDKIFKQNISFNYTDWYSLINNIDNTLTLGIRIFTVEFLPLMIGAFILLVSMIGCISITLEKNRKKKKQNIRKQINQEINIKNILNNTLKGKVKEKKIT